MTIVQLITDNREGFRQYEKKVPWFGTAPEALLQGFVQTPGVKVHMVACTQRPMDSPDKLADNIWFHSLLVPKVGWMRAGYAGCIRAARKKIQMIRPDIVHGQGTERDCALSAIFSGFPNVLTVHGNMRLIARVNKARPFSFAWIAARLEQFTIPRSNGVICITNYTQHAMSGIARKTWVIPNAVDAGFFNLQTKPDQLPTILCVGNISFRKNQNNFIRFLDSLRAAREFQVIFLGMASEKDPYSVEFFQLLESRPWCRYDGFADREKLKDYLCRCTFLALPSLEDNCPMVVLEAMATGVPVLASKVGGLPDLIEINRTGLFCNPSDATTVREGVEKLLDEAGTRQELARNGKTEAFNRFHPKVIAEQHLKVYQEILSIRS